MLLSRDQLAECLDVPPALIDLWRAQGMPAVGEANEEEDGESRATLKGKRWWRITRRELAEFLELHPDTVTHTAWLRPAIITRGGRGKEQVFDVRLVVRAQWAKQGLMESVAREGQAMRAALLTIASADAPTSRNERKGNPGGGETR